MNIVKKAGCILINMKEKKIALVLRNGNYSFPRTFRRNGNNKGLCKERNNRGNWT